MALSTKFITGIIKGLGGPDLDELLENITKELGNEVGSLLRNIVSSSGEKLRAEEEELKRWIEKNPQESTYMTSAVIDKAIEEDSPEAASLLSDYLVVLNFVITSIRRTNRSILLRGFLHDENCTSYWECDRLSHGEPQYFRKPPNSERIMPPSSKPTVHIIDEKPDDSLIRELNLKIRRNKYGRLEEDKYRRAKKIENIEEFTVEFGGYPKQTAEIPLGASGIMAMIQSLTIALEAQGSPKIELEGTLKEVSLGDPGKNA
jgi:hypothetical protein